MRSDQFCEGITLGHPDKLADLIADAVVDAHLRVNPKAHVGCEVLLSKDGITLAGEVNGLVDLNFEHLVKDVLMKAIPKTFRDFNLEELPLNILLHRQSEELSHFHDVTQDQSIVIGYATDETDEKIPFSLKMVRKVLEELKQKKADGSFPYLYEDGKCLIIGNKIEKRVKKIILSHHHTKEISLKELRSDLETFVRSSLGSFADKDLEVLINPAGLFVHGSLYADTGVCGRKIVYDCYGPEVPQGGGAMAGKDPYKVDRWASYLSRQMSLWVINRYHLKKAKVALAFSPNSKTLLGLHLDTFRELKDGEELEIEKKILEVFPLDVQSVTAAFHLDRPIFFEITSKGAFGFPEYPWERLLIK